MEFLSGVDDQAGANLTLVNRSGFIPGLGVDPMTLHTPGTNPQYTEYNRAPLAPAPAAPAAPTRTAPPVITPAQTSTLYQAAGWAETAKPWLIAGGVGLVLLWLMKRGGGSSSVDDSPVKKRRSSGRKASSRRTVSRARWAPRRTYPRGRVSWVPRG